MPALFERHRTDGHKPWLARFCALALLWATCLLYAGGFTTSIQAGMAFLDWPLSDGSVNPEGWLTEPDKRAEHSHRLLGATVGMLTLAIAAWLHVRERRRWMRRLGWIAAALVVAQGALGGARVLFDQLNTGADHNLVARFFAVAHGCTAQLFLCVLVTIAVASTRLWIERAGGLRRGTSRALQTAAIVAGAALSVQLVLGAVMRHSHAGLAMPEFPLTAEGSLLPSTWNFGVGVHFAHRAWAIVVLVALIYFAGRLWAARGVGRVLGAASLVLTLGLALQIHLGALVIWTVRNPHAATLHMLGGAFLLAACWAATLLVHRHRFRDGVAALPVTTSPMPAPAAGGVARA